MGIAMMHVITRLDRGGTVGVVVPLADAARARGLRVRILAGDTPDGRVLAASRPDLDLRLLPALCREISPARDLAAFRAILAQIRRFRPALVHTHTSKAGALGRLAARLCRVPAVVHTPHGHVFSGYFPPLSARLFVAAERLLAPLCDRMIGVSRGEIEETLEARVGRRDRFRLVPSGVALPARMPGRAEARLSLGLPTEARVVGFAGRFEPVKGPDLLVRAFAALAAEDPSLRLLLVGEGSMRKDLERALGVAGLLPRTLFAGWRASPWEAYAAMDLLAVPSRMEGLGKAAIEGLLCGLPVVCADVGGLRTLAAPGRPLFPHIPGDEGSLAAALRRALERAPRHDPATRAELLREYGMPAMVRRTFEVYREALAGRGFAA